MDHALVNRFPPQTVEKVERLLDLLAELGEHPSLKGKLALHGGTAINLFMLDIPRLSVDIDVSYIGAVGRDEMLADRPVVERSIEEVAQSQGYAVSGGDGGHAGRTFVLGYSSAWGPDSVKVDCIYMNRSPLLPIEPRETPLRPGVEVTVFSDAELAGGKTKAFFDRIKVRDLYDVCNLGRVLDGMPRDERETARKAILFYASISASFPHGFSQRPERFVDRQREYEGQLLPMLRQGQELPSLDTLVAGAHAFVSDYIEPKDDAEQEYLERFAAGDFQPSLLFPDESMAAAALASPEAQWKLRNLKLM
ncbi:nucleotidyl transferase, PF08843 family [Coriobacteriaceae bacterium BV3Ac1]|uniref:nucleotidyl transferase AbiEii/AbiGii toxin family protein n=1 Tax=Olegusella massiliensis TaxID=1776381 RepID=UPI0003AE22B0|nr:nucleotidyl transferase AbiEii/AbiGii toxin family protein [Olegusella massiliensis]ERL11669.1 nucleotidyl transferase, PF08843 family [Coriobacteriaceae bacterium BV3Ac1]